MAGRRIRYKQTLRHTDGDLGFRSAVTICGKAWGSRRQAQWKAEADVCLRLVRCSGSAGAGSEVRYRQCVSTGRRQREATAIVDALHALPAPGLCWPCTLLGCCVAAEGWAGVRLSYASRPRYACERCSAMRLATCGACLCRPARFPDGVVEERAYERGLGPVWLGWRRLGLDELLLHVACQARDMELLESLWAFHEMISHTAPRQSGT